MLPHEVFEIKKEEIFELVKEYRHIGFLNLQLFGSVLKKRDTLESDIDFLIDFDAKKEFAFKNLADLADLSDDLEHILGFKVDLVLKSNLYYDIKQFILNDIAGNFLSVKEEKASYMLVYINRINAHFEKINSYFEIIDPNVEKCANNHALHDAINWVALKIFYNVQKMHKKCNECLIENNIGVENILKFKDYFDNDDLEKCFEIITEYFPIFIEKINNLNLEKNICKN